MQTLRPLHGDLVALRRRDQAERRLLRARAMPLPVEIHIPAELAVNPGILTRHVIHHIGGAGVDRHLLPAVLHQRHHPPAVARIRPQQRLAPRGRQGVAERSED